MQDLTTVPGLSPYGDPVLLLLLTAATPTPSPTPSNTPNPFLDSDVGEVLSSQAGSALMVLLAALVAGGAAIFAAMRVSIDTRSRARDDRKAEATRAQEASTRLQTEAELARQERWWTNLTWVYERATAERPEARLSPDIALSLVDALGEQAQTEVEFAAADAVLDIFQDRRQDG